MTAKEFFQKETGYSDEAIEGVLSRTLPMMERFAKKIAIEFAVWAAFSGWHKILSTESDYWFHSEFDSGKPKFTSFELFDLFLTEKNQ